MLDIALGRRLSPLPMELCCFSFAVGGLSSRSGFCSLMYCKANCSAKRRGRTLPSEGESRSSWFICAGCRKMIVLYSWKPDAQSFGAQQIPPDPEPRARHGRSASCCRDGPGDGSRGLGPLGLAQQRSPRDGHELGSLGRFGSPFGGIRAIRRRGGSYQLGFTGASPPYMAVPKNPSVPPGIPWAANFLAVRIVQDRRSATSRISECAMLPAKRRRRRRVERPRARGRGRRRRPARCMEPSKGSGAGPPR